MITRLIKHKVFKKPNSDLEGFWNVYMALTIFKGRGRLREGEESTKYELQSPKNLGERGDNEYERFKEYIAVLRRITLERLFLPLIMLFSKHDTLDDEDSNSLRERRYNIQTDPYSFKSEKYQKIYAIIYEKITPRLLTILVNWFHSIAFSPEQEQTGQTDNPNSILEKIIGIINSSNPDNRRVLVLKLLEAISFSSDQSIEGYIAARLNKKPEESELLKLINPKLLEAQGLTLKYIIRLLEEIFDFKLPSGENLLDQIFQNNQNLSDTSPNEIKDLIKLILLLDRWRKLESYKEKLLTIEEKIQSRTVSDEDPSILINIINGAGTDLFLLTPESENDSLPRNLIEIIVTNSFKEIEIYQKAQELYPQAILVIFENKLERLKNVKEKTDSWFEELEELLNAIARHLRFSFKIQVNENSKIVLSYVDIYYEILLLIIAFKHLKIRSKLPEIQSKLEEIQTYCNVLKKCSASTQEYAEIINEGENSVTQKLTEIINFINEYLALLDRLFGNDWTVRTVFLDSLKFLENPDLDRVKQKLQEITDLLNEIPGLLDEILEIINPGGSNLGTNIEEEIKEIKAEIKKLNAQIAKLKKIIAVTISDMAISDETVSDRNLLAYTGKTQKLRRSPKGANPNWLATINNRLKLLFLRLNYIIEILKNKR